MPHSLSPKQQLARWQRYWGPDRDKHPLKATDVEFFTARHLNQQVAGWRLTLDGNVHQASVPINDPEPFAKIEGREPLKEVLLANARETWDSLMETRNAA